jgi:TPP-dependent pyruvate/acetoin dehydrogenase alpha subunit
MMSKQELIEFETEMAELFNASKIRAMLHLHDDDGIQQLIEIFKGIKEEDWVLCSWRSHIQCLLKGVPKDEVRAEVIAGHSIALCFPKYKILSSGIAGGILPIATGIAIALKRQSSEAKVYCFIGEMTSEMGIAHECIKYAQNHYLPIQFIVEDNGKSVCTDTRKVWQQDVLSFEYNMYPKVRYFKYEMEKYPHSGAGVRVEF